MSLELVVCALNVKSSPGPSPRYSELVPIAHTPFNEERKAYLLLAVIVVVWGANWPIMKVGITHIPPLWFASTRVLLGAACLFALLALRREFRWPVRSDLPILLSVGILQLGIGLGLVHSALKAVEAGRSAILAYTTPIWVAPLAIVLLGERPTPARIGGLAFGLAGLAVLFDPSLPDLAEPRQIAGNVLLLVSAMLVAVVIVHSRRHRMTMTPLQLMPWQLSLGGILLAVQAVMIEGLPEISFTPSLVVILLYNGPIASAFCFWAYFSVMRALPATSTALGSLGVPVAGMLFSAVALGEVLTSAKVLGMGLISVGVALLVRSDFRRSRAAAGYPSGK